MGCGNRMAEKDTPKTLWLAHKGRKKDIMKEQIDILKKQAEITNQRLDNIGRIIDLQQKQVNLLNDSINLLSSQMHSRLDGDMEKDEEINDDSGPE